MARQQGVVRMGAQYSGKCRCQARFVAGAWIDWDVVLRKVVSCEACRPITPRVKASTISEPPAAPADLDPPGSDPFELKD